jgi:N-acetylglutamate synthase-like GNAT family acetyltransferase
MIEIVSAQSGAALQHFISLSQEYVAWMTVEIQRQYPELDLNTFISTRSYDDVRKKFPGEHVPPHGCLLVAMHEGRVCGCAGLARLTDTICEIRTVFVRPDCRGLGVGKKLVEAIISQALGLGYSTMRLDTLRFMDSAQNLYRSLGFYDIEPYVDISADLRRYVCFFERRLLD